MYHHDGSIRAFAIVTRSAVLARRRPRRDKTGTGSTRFTSARFALARHVINTENRSRGVGRRGWGTSRAGHLLQQGEHGRDTQPRNVTVERERDRIGREQREGKIKEETERRERKTCRELFVFQPTCDCVIYLYCYLTRDNALRHTAPGDSMCAHENKLLTDNFSYSIRRARSFPRQKIGTMREKEGKNWKGGGGGNVVRRR